MLRSELRRVPAARWTYHRVRSFRNRGLDYPETSATSGADEVTVAFVREHGCRVIAEVGIYRGDTSLELARVVGGEGELHLFDFAERVETVAARIAAEGFRNVVCHGNTHRLLDSYNWSLMRDLEAHPEGVYDYVYLDGAHTWAHDALAFLLIDRLLKPGGYVDFDDHDWTLASSPSMNPSVFPRTARSYTEEQIEARQVQLVIDLLVRRDGRYREVVPDKIFQKLR